VKSKDRKRKKGVRGEKPSQGSGGRVVAGVHLNQTLVWEFGGANANVKSCAKRERKSGSEVFGIRGKSL